MKRRQFLQTTSKGLVALLTPTPLLLQGCSQNSKTNKTNQQGQTTFQDSTTDETVTITILDENKKPVQNANVFFYDGNGFETFIAQHPSYLPSFQIFQHNSEHTLSLTSQTGKDLAGLGTMLEQQNKRKLHYTQLLNNQELMKAYGQFEDFLGNKTDVQYLETITLDEKLEIDNENDAILTFVTNQVAAIAGISPSFAGKTRNIITSIRDQTARSLLKSFETWDVYCIKGDLDIIQLMPSNSPTVSLNQPQITEESITLSWKTDDALEYPRNYSLNFPDLTAKLGKTKKSDLESRLIIKRDGQKIIDGTTSSPYTIQNPEPGSYTWFVRVTDEVENTTESQRLSFTYINIKDKEAIEDVINELFDTMNGVWDGDSTENDYDRLENFAKNHLTEELARADFFWDGAWSDLTFKPYDITISIKENEAKTDYKLKITGEDYNQLVQIENDLTKQNDKWRIKTWEMETIYFK